MILNHWLHSIAKKIWDRFNIIDWFILIMIGCFVIGAIKSFKKPCPKFTCPACNCTSPACNCSCPKYKECLECEECIECETCPDCNCTCPECKECPKCKECPECEACPECPTVSTKELFSRYLYDQYKQGKIKIGD